jgi:hypothetical protein
VRRVRLAGKWEIPLLPDDLPRQPFHAAAGLDAQAAVAMVRQVEQAAEAAAAAGLRGVVAELGARRADVLGVAVVVKAVSVPSDVSQVLRSHAWMHAAEGVLYRQAVLAGARTCGWRAYAVEQTRQPPDDPRRTDLAKSADPPWRRIQKGAASAALTLVS